MREQEAKLSVGGDFEVPDLNESGHGLEVLAPVERTVVDVYHDTADLRLLRWGCTLRHRKRQGWTVKLPVDADATSLTRNEVNLGGRAGKPPVGARRLVASFARGEPLIEVATITTGRTARPLRSAEGVPLGEVTDDRVTGQTGDGRTTTFRQIEIELAPDSDPELLGPILQALTTAGATPQAAGIKLALVLDEPELVPDVAVPDLPGRLSAHQVIHRAIARSVEQLILELPFARLGQDPEGIHQARVATRRLRSDLRTFKPLLDQDWAAQLHPRLRDLAGHLGQVRDADVLHHLLQATLQAHPELDQEAGEEILALLASQRAEVVVALDAHLDRPATDRLLEDLIAAAGDPPVTAEADEPAKDRLPRLVTKRWQRLNRAIDALDRHPPAEALHEIRILTKRTRYATEAIAPAFGNNTRRFAKSLAALQDTLGDLNDATVASQWLTHNAADLGPVAAFTAGRLTETLHHNTHHNGWATAWTKARKRQPSWLR